MINSLILLMKEKQNLRLRDYFICLRWHKRKSQNLSPGILAIVHPHNHSALLPLQWQWEDEEHVISECTF